MPALRSLAGGPHAGAVLTIDLDALCENHRLLAARSQGAECAAVVKADAYGLGVQRVAPALAAAGCRVFFVATLDEGIALRREVADTEICVLDGLPPGGAEEFTAWRLTPVLNHLGEIASWAAFARSGGSGAGGRGLRAVLHVDTGMTRLGLPKGEVEALERRPDKLHGVEVAWVMSHLACAEEPDHPKNPEQLAAFNRLRAALPPAPASFANSSGIFLGADYHFDMVRPGAALYGINPTPKQPNPMAEVVRLQAKIIQLREIDGPVTVGYGAAHEMTGPGRIATVPVGYADGFLRAFSRRGFGVVGGVRVPIVGRVSMDLITLDVSELAPEEAKPGTLVDLIGGAMSVDEVAGFADTIAYEILVQLGRRYHRVYREGATRP